MKDEQMPLSTALEALVMDGRYTVHFINGNIVVWNNDADDPTEPVARLEVSQVMRTIYRDTGGMPITSGDGVEAVRVVNAATVKFLTGYHD